jgi:hypothetical protein
MHLSAPLGGSGEHRDSWLLIVFFVVVREGVVKPVFGLAVLADLVAGEILGAFAAAVAVARDHDSSSLRF